MQSRDMYVGAQSKESPKTQEANPAMTLIACILLSQKAPWALLSVHSEE